MKKLLYIILLLPLWVNAQNVTMNKTNGYLRTLVSGTAVDSVMMSFGTGVNGYIPIYNSTLKKNVYTNPNTIIPTQYWQRSGTTLSPLTSGDNISTTGNITADSLKRTGGTSTEFLKGDGSVTSLGTSSISLGGSANGLSYSAGNYRLHRATSSTGGVFTASTDTIGGLKNFYDNINLGKTGTPGKVSFRRSSDGAVASTIEQVNDNKLTLTSAGGTRLFDISADTVMFSSLTNGLVKSSSGIISNAVAGTDYLTPTGSGSGLSGVVLTTTNQSIAGQKTFSDVTTFSTTVTSSTPAGFYTLQGSGISTDFSAIDLRNGSGTTRFGTEGNSGNKVFTGSTNNASIFGSSTNTPIEFGLNGTIRAVISPTGTISSTPQGTLYGTATGSITSAQLATSLTDETGTGSAVFSASPTFTGTVVGASAGFTTGVNLATSSGSVGVGTATPDYIFDVENSVSNNYVARINNTNTTAGTSFGLLINGGTNSSDNALVINNSANSITLFSHSGAGDLTIYGSNATKASGTAWINPSDLRLKTNIGEYSKGLKEVLAIKPKTWYFNEASGLDKTQKHLSPIAQELQQIMPEMVSTYKGKLNGKEQELLQVDASDMTWLLVKAIQDQQAIIEKLNQRITVLEKK